MSKLKYEQLENQHISQSANQPIRQSTKAIRQSNPPHKRQGRRRFAHLLICMSALATTPAAFYSIGAGARALALGSAFVATADDVSAVYWNPAGITQLSDPALQLMDRIVTLDTNYANLAGVLPIGGIGAVGLNVIFFSVDEIQGYDELGNAQGEFSDKEAAIGLSYAYGVRGISLGVNVKTLYQRLGSISDNSTRTWGVGVDVAVLYQISNRLRLGVTFHDKIKMRDADDETEYSVDIPRSITSGIFYQIPIGTQHHWGWMADFEQRHEHPLQLHVGSELVFYKTLFLRAGLNDVTVETRDAEIDFDELFSSNLKPTLGLGISRKLNTTTLTLDYAASFERVGTRNFVSLSAVF